MLVYRATEQRVEARSQWEMLRRQAAALGTGPSFDRVVDLVVDLGTLEAALSDSLNSTEDRLDPLLESLGSASVAAGRLLTAFEPSRRHGLPELCRTVEARIAAVPTHALPTTVALRVPEGYAYYALHPETYAASAARFLRTERPSRVVCLGVRSIGTSLSGVVAAELEWHGVPVERHTLRPRGHPFERVTLLADGFGRHLRDQPLGTTFVVVDEGPGLSGSSLASVANALMHHGVACERIVFMPAWSPDGSRFRSESARRTWARIRRYSASQGSAWKPAVNGQTDFSGGLWRAHLLDAVREWPAVHPQHERLKRRSPDGHWISRFAGLGRYGTARAVRAAALAGRGAGPPATSLGNGYLTLPFVGGRPCTSADVSHELLDALARHAAIMTDAFGTGRDADPSTFDQMVDVNVRESLGAAAPAVLRRALRLRASTRGAPEVQVDGRMLPHEWIRTATGFVKVDALDHHDDHFFPGPCDVAWDLAAAVTEFELDAAARAYLVRRYVDLTGDGSVHERLPYYRIAWLAFRVGYATLASESLAGTDDGERFARERHRYARLLRHSQ